MAIPKIVLIACGSFNPPTNMHMRMLEIARDNLNSSGQFRVIGGIISPVHDAYPKKELEAATHRVEMLKLALKSSNWIRVSEWEIHQEGWTRTLPSLQYFQNTLNTFLQSNNKDCTRENRLDLELPYSSWATNEMRSSKDPIRVMLVCGADMLESFGIPGLWKETDIEEIIGNMGLVVVTRVGSQPERFIYESDLLTRYRRNIILVNEWISNEISSSKVRRALRRMESVKYLIDDAVIDYISKNGLYGCDKYRFKYENVVDNYLSIPLNTFLMTPSPSDVNMLSVSPSKADDDITLQLQPIGRIDEPDTVINSQEQLKDIKSKSETEVVQYPGKPVQILPVEGSSGKSKKVGFADESECVTKVITSLKDTPEILKIVVEKSISPKKVKKPPRLSDPTRSRNVFKRCNSDVPTSHSNPDLEATAVKIEFTKDGVKVISDKESMV